MRVGKNPVYIDVNPYNQMVYVANKNSATISVINETTNEVAATIPVGIHPIALVSDNGYVYVSNQESNSISVINDTTNRVVATIPVGIRPTNIISYTPPSASHRFDGGYFYHSIGPATPGPILPRQ